MTEQEQRQAVAREARSWLGTAYHHNARVKGVGVDCAQLPIAVYAEVGLIPPIDPSYSSQWHLHRSEELYVQHVLQYGREIARGEVQTGDLVLWRWGRTYSHGGIVLDFPMVIHSYIGLGVQIDDMTIHHDLANAVRHPARFFTLWGR
jgi:cell wall-associated NlpC family hydrolase